jgi:DNA-binding transcriptional ArsR family regulator
LKVLREHQLVDVREDGQHRYYRLAPGPLGLVRRWLDGVAPQVTPAGLVDSAETPYVDLWPAGYQVGTWIAGAQDALNRFIGQIRP